jgi:hypothetical protein
MKMAHGLKLNQYIKAAGRGIVAGAFTCVALGSAAGSVHAEQVSSSQRSVTVKYNTGSSEQYVVVWTADTVMNVGEDGGPAKPLEGHFVDDRRCHWNIHGSVTRQVFLVNQLGQQFASPTLTRVYTKGQANEGASFILLGLRSENCGDARGRRESDYSNMKQLELGDFPATVETDFVSVKSELKQNAGVVKVSDNRPPVTTQASK